TRPIIDIVSHWQQLDFETYLSRALSRLSKHTLGAPINSLKEFFVRLLKSNQIIATIGARTEDDTITGALQESYCLREIFRGNGRAVRIDQAHRFKPALE